MHQIFSKNVSVFLSSEDLQIGLMSLTHWQRVILYSVPSFLVFKMIA